MFHSMKQYIKRHVICSFFVSIFVTKYINKQDIHVLMKIKKHFGFMILTLLLLLVSIVTFVTDTSRHMTNKSSMLEFLVQNHTIIMFMLVVIAIGFGFFWSNLSLIELEKQKKGSRQILDVIMLFLNKEEKEIIKFLVENKGVTTQAEISRLNGLNRVKAYRSVQKMQEKKLVEVIPHGKIRKIKLKENILNIIKD